MLYKLLSKIFSVWKKFLKRDTIYKSRYRSPSETEKYHRVVENYVVENYVVENYVVEIHVSQGIAVSWIFCHYLVKG